MKRSASESRNLMAQIQFSGRFSALVSVGVTLVRSLSVLEQDAPPPYDKAAGRMRESVERGRMLSEVFEELPDLFSPFYAKTVRIGEIGGMLDVSLAELAGYLESALKAWAGTGGRGPWGWLFCPAGRPVPDDWGNLDEAQRKLLVVLFCRSLGSMLAAGVPLGLALETAADLLPLAQRAAVLGITGEPIERLGERLGEIGFLPPVVVRMISVADCADPLPAVLERAAETYHRELECELLADV